MNAQIKHPVTLDAESDAPYEAPHVEMVLTEEELEREVLYAGNGSQQR